MPLLPRWRYMTPEAKALSRRVAVSGGLILVALLLFRGLIPWLLLGLAAWWIWRALSR
jgi:hypothetical protein